MRPFILLMKTSFIQRILFFALFTIQVSYSQKNIDPTPEHIQLAKQLKEKFKKQDIAILSSTEKVSFSLNPAGDNVVADLISSNELMNISQRTDIHLHEGYDSQSEITEFTVKYRNGKNAKFEIKDQIHNNNEFFYNDYRIKHVAVDFPVQGYSYSYDVHKKYNDAKYFTVLYFNSEYPTLKKNIEITVPDWLELEIKEFNFAGSQITVNKKADQKNRCSVYTFTAENLPEMSNEESCPGPSYLYPHILVIPKSFTKNNKKTTLFNNTADLYKWYKSLVNSIDEKPSELKDKVNELTKGAKNDDEKIKNIYYWVQDNIRYIAFEDGLAGFRPDASQNVFKKRYGDCKGMANLIRQMLREAGFDARLTWIGTKHIAYDYSIPSLVVDNHMICTLFKDGKKYYLDGTEKFNSLGEYAERIQGKQVMIEDGENYIIEQVPVALPASNKETYSAVLAIDGESLSGSVDCTMKGESRASFLYGYNNIQNDRKENALQKFLTGRNDNLAVSNIKTSDLTNRDATLTVHYDALIKNKVSVFDNEMYIDLDYMEEFSGLNFKERVYDYEMGYKQDYETSVVLQIPQGYKVAKLPQGMRSEHGGYSVALNYEQKGNTIIYTKKFIFANGAIKNSEFTKWNETHGQLKKMYKEQITLIKN